MMLLSGCKSKHSDYTPSSGLSSSVVFSDLETFLSAPNLYIKLFGRLVGSKQKDDDFSKFWRQLTGKKENYVMYYFEVCSKEGPQQPPQRCIKPFYNHNDNWIWFRSAGIIELLYRDRAGDFSPGSTPYIEYVERREDGKFKTISYFNFDKAKLEDLYATIEIDAGLSFMIPRKKYIYLDRAKIEFDAIIEGYYRFMRPKEKLLRTYATAATKDPLPPYEITARDLMKLASVISKYSRSSYYMRNNITWVCHPLRSINCAKEIKH